MLADVAEHRRRLEDYGLHRPYCDKVLSSDPCASRQFCSNVLSCGVPDIGRGCACSVEHCFVAKKFGVLRVAVDCRLSILWSQDPPEIDMGLGDVLRNLNVEDTDQIYTATADISN